MCLPIILGTMNELLSQENTIIPVSLTIAITGQIYSIKDIWKNEKFFDNLRIKIEMIIVLSLLSVSLLYTAWVFTLRQVSNEGALSEILKNHIVSNMFNKNFWGSYTIPTILYGASIFPYFWEAVSVLSYEFKICKPIRNRKI